MANQVNLSSFNTNLKKKQLFYKKKGFKKKKRKFSKISKPINIKAFACEYEGKLKIALKLYLIFFQTNKKNWVYVLKIIFFSFWNGFFYRNNNKFQKLPINNSSFTYERSFFFGKSFEYWGNYSFSSTWWKKNYIKKNISGQNKSKYNIFLTFHLFCFWLRSTIKGVGLSSDFYQLKKMLYFWDFSNKKTLKEKFYFCHIFFEFQSRYRQKFASQFKALKIFENFKNFQSIPLVPTGLSFLIEKSLENSFKGHFKKIFKYLGIFPKWSVCFGKEFSTRKWDLSFFIDNQNFYRKIFSFGESFNPLFRNKAYQQLFFYKITNVHKKKKKFVQILSIFRLMALEKPDCIKIISFLMKIQKKIFSKRKATETFYMGAKIHYQKNLEFFEKDKKQKIKMVDHIENFFEGNKLVALSRLVTSVFLFHIQPQKKLKKKKLYSSFPQKKMEATPKRKTIHRNTSNKQFLFWERKEGFFTFEKLFESILFFLLKNPNSFLENSFQFLFGSLVLFKKGTEKRRFLSIFFLIQKKKFIRAYRLLRLECLTHPNSIEGWYFLSDLEKKIGLIVSKTLRYSLRILMKFPETVPGIIFTGNHCSNFGSFGYALAEYFQAYRWKKNSPFLNFVIFIQYLRGSLNRRNFSRGFAILLSICFFWRYKILRDFTAQHFLERNQFSVLLEKEVSYNFGNFYLFLGSNHLAFNYLKVAKKKRIEPERTSKVTRFRKFSGRIPFHTQVFLNISLFVSCLGKQ